MIRIMMKDDLQQCGEIYAMVFPIEYWGIDWNSDNAREYLTDYYEQKKFIGYMYKEDDMISGTDKLVWSRHRIITGIVLMIICSAVFILTRQPYAGILCFSILIVKGILISKI